MHYLTALGAFFGLLALLSVRLAISANELVHKELQSAGDHDVVMVNIIKHDTRLHKGSRAQRYQRLLVSAIWSAMAFGIASLLCLLASSYG